MQHRQETLTARRSIVPSGRLVSGRYPMPPNCAAFACSHKNECDLSSQYIDRSHQKEQRAATDVGASKTPRKKIPNNSGHHREGNAEEVEGGCREVAKRPCCCSDPKPPSSSPPATTSLGIDGRGRTPDFLTNYKEPTPAWLL